MRWRRLQMWVISPARYFPSSSPAKPGSATSTSWSGPAARSGCPTSCFGRAPTPNCISPNGCGPILGAKILRKRWPHSIAANAGLAACSPLVPNWRPNRPNLWRDLSGPLALAEYGYPSAAGVNAVDLGLIRADHPVDMYQALVSALRSNLLRRQPPLVPQPLRIALAARPL